MVICFTKYLLHEKQQLSKIWLAAHWEKKIKKTQIFEVDIERSVQDIMEAEIILDLRLSGHLLVGIVKIHSKKSKYLLTECSSIFYQIKVFRTTPIDLPDNKQTAAMKDITLTDIIFDNFPAIENDIIDSLLNPNQCRVEDITLKETNARLSLLDDFDMRDFVFNEEEICENFDENLQSLEVNLETEKDLNLLVEKNKSAVNEQLKNPNTLNVENEDALNIGSDIDIFNSNSPQNLILENTEFPCIPNNDIQHCQPDNSDASSIVLNPKAADVLNLQPLQISTKKISKTNKPKKRKLCVDDVLCIPNEVLKRRMLDTFDVTTVLDIAPRSKRLMTLKETGTAKKLITLPFLKLQNPKLLQIYQRHLRTEHSDNFELLSEKESSEHAYKPRKRSKIELPENPIQADENPLQNFEDEAMSINTCSGVDVEHLMPGANVIVDMDLENIIPDPVVGMEAESCIPAEPTFNDKSQSNDAQASQSTPKTSQEKWEYALQGRIVQMLKHLKLLFQERSVICFSSLVQNNRKLMVSQKFFCLLMLKKFEVIRFEQSKSYDEIFISPDLNFESACCKFCSSSAF